MPALYLNVDTGEARCRLHVDGYQAKAGRPVTKLEADGFQWNYLKSQHAAALDKSCGACA
jgi:hypothetical protein